ncbi:MAG: class I SAM-dependent methyltransferase [Gemmatimonadota bacterium]
MAGSESNEWWTEYFDEVFLRIYRPLLDSKRTEAEIDAALHVLQLLPTASVLDVACGWGRHALELASRGFAVTGYDQSAYLLEQAEQCASDGGVEVRWRRGDMRALPFHAEFDAALSLFSSLGYFGDDHEDETVLSGIRSAVKTGGSLLLETMHRDLVAREFAERDWWETPDGDTVRVDREFDAIAGVSRERLHWRAADGAEGEKFHAIRIRSASEWKRLLEGAGWRPIEWFGNWELDPFTHQSERLIVLCRADGSSG